MKLSSSNLKKSADKMKGRNWIWKKPLKSRNKTIVWKNKKESYWNPKINWWTSKKERRKEVIIDSEEIERVSDGKFRYVSSYYSDWTECFNMEACARNNNKDWCKKRGIRNMNMRVRNCMKINKRKKKNWSN